MKIQDFLDTLPEPARSRTLGRLEGMTMAMRIARNRAADLAEVAKDSGTAPARDHYSAGEAEAHTIASVIRMVQVGVGNGSLPFSDLTPEELDEIRRIY